MHHPARNTDPASSHEAADAITASGRRAAQQAQAAAAVRADPGKTSLELSQSSGIDRYTLARRLPEIEEEDQVHRGAERQCSVSKRRALTWWPGPKPTPATPLRQPIRNEEQA